MRNLGGHRYGLVLLLLLVDVLFAVLAPDGTGSRLVGLALQSLVLVVIIVTSGHALSVRRWGIAAVVLAVLAACTVAAFGHDPSRLVNGVNAVMIIASLVELVRGMTRLLRGDGVTVQAIAGGIAIYLLLGLLFAVIISLLATYGTQPYFQQGMNGTTSDHVYFSFTSMTTTGFGDFSPATRPGRSVAVLEMLVGQIYLVTVISLLVARAPRRSTEV